MQTKSHTRIEGCAVEASVDVITSVTEMETSFEVFRAKISSGRQTGLCDAQAKCFKQGKTYPMNMAILLTFGFAQNRWAKGENVKTLELRSSANMMEYRGQDENSTNVF